MQQEDHYTTPTLYECSKNSKNKPVNMHQVSRYSGVGTFRYTPGIEQHTRYNRHTLGHRLLEGQSCMFSPTDY